MYRQMTCGRDWVTVSTALRIMQGEGDKVTEQNQQHAIATVLSHPARNSQLLDQLARPQDTNFGR